MKRTVKTIRTFLKIKYMENGKALWYCVEIALIILAFAIRKEKTIGLTLITGLMLLNAYFVSTFHNRNGVDIILRGDGRFQKIKAPLVIAAGLTENFPICVATLLYVCLNSEKINFLCPIYALLLFLSITAVGLFIGYFFKKQNIGFMVSALLITINLQKTLFLEENMRYFSPVVQLANMNTFQWWNLSVLLVIAIAAYLLISIRRHRYRLKSMIAVCMLILIGVIIAIDVSFSERMAVVPSEYKVYAENILKKVNKMNGECGFLEYDNIKVYKSIYYPWESSREKRVIYTQDNTLYMNCFTESLCCMSEDEIVIRSVRSLLKAGSKSQRAMEDLYVNCLLGNSEYVKGFLYDSQIKIYGEIVSEAYGFYSEILLKDPCKFAELYELGGKYSTSKEVMEAWSEKAD